ncbi:unnamed protein product, partial [Scytosiphon promiscuus]
AHLAPAHTELRRLFESVQPQPSPPQQLHKGSQQPASCIFPAAYSLPRRYTRDHRRYTPDVYAQDRRGQRRASDPPSCPLQEQDPGAQVTAAGSCVSGDKIYPGRCTATTSRHNAHLASPSTPFSTPQPTMPPTPHQHHTDENTSPTLLGRRQDLMVPAATSEASAASDRKPRANNNAIKNMSASGDRKVEPLIVFDWDDTILTSSWIQVNELLQAGSYDDLPLDVKRDLAQLEQSVVKCLKNARRLGTVIIITNAESGWVELSAARFFVGVLPLLEGVPVISARSLFESQFPGSPLCWKSAAFAYMMHDHFLDRPQWLQKKVVSIGDSNEEKVAMRIASGQHGTMAAKAIKFITGPDPEALSCQLDFVTQHLASVVSSDSDVDIVLDASMIHGSHSLPLHSRGVYDDQRRLRQEQQEQQQQQQHAPTTAASRPPSTSSSSRRAPFDLSRTESGPAGRTEPSSTSTTSPMSPQSTAGSRSGSTSEARGPFSRAR